MFVPYVNVRYKVAYSELSFFKEDSTYEASYDIAVNVMDKGKQVGGKNIRRTIIVEDYYETISKSTVISDQIRYNLNSGGNYLIKFKMWDLQSGKKWEKEEEMKVPEIKDLYSSVQWLSNPSYKLSTEDTLREIISIYDPDEQGAELIYFFKSAEGDIYYERDTVFKGRSFYKVDVEIPGNRFPESDYKMIVRLKDLKGKEIKEDIIDFEIRLPFFRSRRFIERVKQLEYIASTEEINRLKNAPVEKRQGLWEDFWEERDPTSGKEVNEFRNEYYRRIDYANENFTTGLTEGWKTDRGKVFVLLGPPDSIERHPFEMERKPYQIWYYYDRGYRLIFLEQYNLGEYKLINPPAGF